MKRDDFLTATGHPTAESPPPRADTEPDCVPEFDLVILYLGLNPNRQLSSNYLRKHWWLHNHLPDALPSARILAYEFSSNPAHESGYVDSIQNFALIVLNSLNKKREGKVTADRPLIILIHNNSSGNMLLFLVLSLLSMLDNCIEFFGLRVDTRGILCLNSLDNRLIPPYTMSGMGLHTDEFFDGTFSGNGTHEFMIPITIFLNDRTTSGTSNATHEVGSERLNSNISTLFLPYFKNINTVYVRLDEQSHPLGYPTTKRISAEILKWATPSILPGHGIDAAGIHRWLSPATSLFGYDSPRHLKGSYEWFFQNPVYNEWHATGNSLLWITGKPGCGKTTLAKSIAHSIRNESISFKSSSTVATLFCDYRYPFHGNRGSNKSILLQALLYQIIENKPSVLSRLCYSNFESHVSKQLKGPSLASYQHYLRKLVSAITAISKLFIIVDGLDECESEIQDDILDCVDLIRNAPLEIGKVRVAVSSRWLPTLERKYHTTQINLDAKNTQDIANFCFTMLSSKFAWHRLTLPYDFKDLVDRITKLADGSFLWVYLILNQLPFRKASARRSSAYSTEILQHVLHTFPSELYSLYAKLLNNVLAEHKHASRLLLTWCSFVFRPLTLKELRSALYYSDSGPGPESDWGDELLLNFVYRLSCGLVQVRHDPSLNMATVQFIHKSVKDYLLGDGIHHIQADSRSLRTTVGLSHTLIARACVSYLENKLFSTSNTKDAFVSYSVLYWGLHANAADKLGYSQAYIVNTFRWPALERVSIWTNAYDRLIPPNFHIFKPTSLLHMVAFYGVLSMAEALLPFLEKNPIWNDTDENGLTPLHYAVERSNRDLITLLIQHGAAVDFEDMKGNTPLLRALKNDDLHTVTLLLDAGADSGLKNVTGMTPLQFAVQCCSMEIVEYLLDVRNVSFLNRYDVVALALNNGNEPVAEFLISYQTQGMVTLSSKTTGVVLGIASALGMGKLVQKLLLSTRFISSKDPALQQAFIASVSSFSKFTVLQFLDFGCDPNTRDRQYGQTALSIAVGSGSESIVRLLLDRGANPNTEDAHTYNTPLMHAISRGFIRIVGVLLLYGARLVFPRRPSVLADHGWIFRIITDLIRTCGNDPSNNNGQGSGNSSTESVVGTPSPPTAGDQFSQPSNALKRKNTPDDGDGEEPTDQCSNPKRICGSGKNRGFACPFQKRFPNKHQCTSQPNIARLKAHLHNKHTGFFCRFCWDMFKSDDDMQVHLQSGSCKEKDRKKPSPRVDFSSGMSKEQGDELKSRKGWSKKSDEEKWVHIFGIIFPDRKDNIPSSIYHDGSEDVRQRWDHVVNIMTSRDLSGEQQLSLISNLVHLHAEPSAIGNIRMNQPENVPVPAASTSNNFSRSSTIPNSYGHNQGTSSTTQQTEMHTLDASVYGPPQLEDSFAHNMSAAPSSDSGYSTLLSQHHAMASLGGQDPGPYSMGSNVPPLGYTFEPSFYTHNNWSGADPTAVPYRPAANSNWFPNNYITSDLEENEE